MAHKTGNLQELWSQVKKLQTRYFPSHPLQPILGGGREHHPKAMFVFINPTHRNISSYPSWRGPRYPFIGTNQIWRVFHQAGLFDDRLMQQIEQNTTWSVVFAEEVLAFLRKKGFYLTNLVKWTGPDATLPTSDKIKLFLPILQEEIVLVQPKYIVTFGLPPFLALARQTIKLDSYYTEVMRNHQLRFFDLDGAKLVPCYFPIGRGNPRRAIEILKLVGQLR